MANRVLRDFTDSEKVDFLSADAERFFTRLFMKADDYGRFHAHPSLLLANLFPLKIGVMETMYIEKCLSECIAASLVNLYEVGGKKYLSINNFDQRLRIMRSKFPAPPESADNPPSSDSNPPPETETNPKQETESETRNKKQKRVRNFVPPSLDDVIKFFIEKGFPETLGSRAWSGYHVADWHDSRGNPIKNWKQKMIQVWMKEENRNYGTTNHNNRQQTPARNASNHELASAVAKRHGITENGSANGN